jgi:hypothetical protein
MWPPTGTNLLMYSHSGLRAPPTRWNWLCRVDCPVQIRLFEAPFPAVPSRCEWSGVNYSASWHCPSSHHIINELPRMTAIKSWYPVPFCSVSGFLFLVRSVVCWGGPPISIILTAHPSPASWHALRLNSIMGWRIPLPRTNIIITINALCDSTLSSSNFCIDHLHVVL